LNADRLVDDDVAVFRLLAGAERDDRRYGQQSLTCAHFSPRA